MSFQFPANPSDGDIVVRGNLQAFYNAVTNTWRVSEVPTAPGIPGPPGPPGPTGPEGKGVEISGIVDTFADLPAPNAHQFEFWLVDDTNTLYNSDGITWRDFGGPIQGPQGDPGADGSNGTNGQNGRGWYDTEIIDQRPTNYQIKFLSNDNLGFTTGNILGPKGDTGSLVQASETTLGGIKIGRGLSIAPDGTTSAGQTDIDLETTPLEKGFQVAYRPIFHVIGDSAEYGQLGKWEGGVLQTGSVEVQMPEKANRAMVYFFGATNIRPHPNFPNLNDYFYAFRGYYVQKLAVSSAVYQGINATALGWVSSHNMGILSNPFTVASRFSNLPTTKFDVIEFAPGDKIKFDYTVENIVSANLIFSAPSARMVVVPFRVGDNRVITPDPNELIVKGDSVYFGSNYSNEDAFNALVPNFPDQIENDAVDNLKIVIQRTQELINTELIYNELPRLIEIRDLLRNARDLPGTIDDIQNYVYPLAEEATALTAYNFRFE